VKNSFIYGIGVHMVPSGWLYNVSGKYAIELSFKSNNKKIRIGTDKPDEISHIINKQINGSMAGSYFDKGGHGGLYLIGVMIAATIILPILLISYGGRETEITLSDSSMKLSGMYGLQMEYSDIKQADTMQTLPAIRSRTNGYASGKILKGHFKLKDQSKVMLFIKKGVPPYICIKTSGETIYLNSYSPVKTRELFSTIKGRIE
jgi:hypothetical protein